MSYDQNLEELKKELKKSKAELVDTAQLFEVLLRHEGWKRYTAMLNSMLGMKTAEILAPSEDANGAMRSEFKKGTMSGLIMARDLPSAIVAEMKAAESQDEDE